MRHASMHATYVCHHSLVCVTQAVWSYIRRYKCQNPEDPTRVICNARLKALFEEDTFELSSLPQRLSKHLSLAPAALLEHTIK